MKLTRRNLIQGLGATLAATEVNAYQPSPEDICNLINKRKFRSFTEFSDAVVDAVVAIYKIGGRDVEVLLMDKPVSLEIGYALSWRDVRGNVNSIEVQVHLRDLIGSRDFLYREHRLELAKAIRNKAKLRAGLI